jgi:hypothetical protein
MRRTGQVRVHDPASDDPGLLPLPLTPTPRAEERPDRVLRPSPHALRILPPGRGEPSQRPGSTFAALRDAGPGPDGPRVPLRSMGIPASGAEARTEADHRDGGVRGAGRPAGPQPGRDPDTGPTTTWSSWPGIGQGYRNLVKLSSLGYTEGFYHKPRVDREVLQRHSEGLIVSSACLAGEVARHLMDGNRTVRERPRAGTRTSSATGTTSRSRHTVPRGRPS